MTFSRSRRALLALLPLWALAAPGQPPSAGQDERVTALALDSDRAHLGALLAQGLSVSARGPEGRTVLMAVASWIRPDPEAVALLLSRGASPAGTDDHGETALSMAACSGSAAVVRLLLEHGADPNLGQPLRSAVQCPGSIRARREHAEVVRLLLARGAAVDGCDGAGRRALHFAAMKGDVENMRLLLAAGSDPNVLEDNTGNAPLHWASAVGALAPVELLLASGAAVDLRNPADCATALHRAAANGHLAVARALVAHGADPGATDHHGATPLGLAVGGQQAAMATYLRTLTDRESGVPMAVCPPPDGLIRQACRAEQPSPAAAPRTALVAGELRTRVRRLVARWEARTGTLVAPEIALEAETQVAALLASACYSGAAEPERSRCRAVLDTDSSLAPPLEAFLAEALTRAAPTIRPLFNRVGDAVVPDLVLRLGWPDTPVPNRTRCTDLPPQLRTSAAFFPERASLHVVGPPIHRICVLPGAYTFALRDPATGATRVLALDAGQRAPPRLTALAAPGDLASAQVLPDLRWFCPGSTPDAISPLTAALGRDSPAVRQEERAAFSDATLATVTVDDPSGSCQNTCRDALALQVVEAVQLWRAGCSRCPFSTLGAVAVDGRIFVARPVLDLLLQAAPGQADQLLSRDPRDPRRLAGPIDLGTMTVAGEPGPGGPLFPFVRFSPGTQLAGEVCRALDDSRSVPARSLLSLLCRQAPATDCPGCVGLRIALARRITLGCPDKSDTIACGAVDRGIEINIRDFHFTGLSWPSAEAALPTQRSLRFGFGGQEMDILPVLVHETGHWFGLPHLMTEAESAPGPVNAMFPDYHPEGHCITPANLRMTNQAADRGWHFRIVTCDGFRLARAPRR